MANPLVLNLEKLINHQMTLLKFYSPAICFSSAVPRATGGCLRSWGHREGLGGMGAQQLLSLWDCCSALCVLYSTAVLLLLLRLN